MIDAVLLSFPDVAHLGLLPYLMGPLELKCPVYATVPVYKMGQMFMYDLYQVGILVLHVDRERQRGRFHVWLPLQSRKNSEDFDLFTLDDVDKAFDNIIQVKYAQTVQLKGIIHSLSLLSVI